jgi:hypothetical protein
MTTLEDAPRDPVDELGILLARYADTVLKPDPFAMDRVRSELRARAQRASVHRRAEALAVAASPVTVLPVRRGLFAGWSLRRASFAVAASLVLGLSVATTSFAASRAGGPLYETRIWIETATLPRDAGPRLQAELAFAETRLAEAAAGASAHDAGAVTAALDAFNGIIVMTCHEQEAHGTGRATAIEAFQHHLQLLKGLAATVPPAAQAAVTHALAESSKAVQVLETAPGQPTDPAQGSSNGQGGAGGNGGTGGDPGQGGSNGGGVPGVPGNDPQGTPKPGRTPTPADPAPTPSHGNPGDGNAGNQGGNGGNQGGNGGGDDGGRDNGGGAHSPPSGNPAGGEGPIVPPGQERAPKP